MDGGAAAFVTLAINPVGGLMIAIPFALLKLKYPVWLVFMLGVPLSYVQVVAVDLGWSVLTRIPGWHRFLERRRSKRVERLMAAKGAFWVTVLAAPLLGPWLVMAFMRYANIRQQKVILPIMLGLCWNAAAIVACCWLVPQLFHLAG